MVVKRRLLGIAALVACVSDRPPTPLYPDPGRQLAPHEIATLHGDVRDVDGKFVSEYGGAFALLPGCHVVGVVEKWGRVDPQMGGVVANLPRIVFAIPMQGGHRYVVRIDARVEGGPTGSVNITAHEEDAQGNVTQTFSPTSDAAAVAECKSGA